MYLSTFAKINCVCLFAQLVIHSYFPYVSEAKMRNINLLMLTRFIGEFFFHYDISITIPRLRLKSRIHLMLERVNWPYVNAPSCLSLNSTLQCTSALLREHLEWNMQTIPLSKSLKPWMNFIFYCSRSCVAFCIHLRTQCCIHLNMVLHKTDFVIFALRQPNNN